MNAAMAAVSGSFALGFGASMVPGLFSPWSATYSSSGLNLTATLPAPFGVLFSNGVITQAHGLLTNSDTQTYTVPFSGVLPASGSITAYLLVSGVSIQQQPKQIIGPQPGHPDYNPAFTPYTAYQVNVDSLALFASSSAANNTTTFELGRFTLTSGSTTLATINTNYQVLASTINFTPVIYVSGGTYNVSAAQNALTFLAGAPTTFQLPAVSGLNGSDFEFIAATSGTTLQVSGSDLIYGSTTNPTSGVTIAPISARSSISVEGAVGSWYANGNAIGALGGVLTGYLPNPGMASGAAATNVGALGGALGGTLPNPTMAAGAAATNVGTLSGVLSGTLPSPGMAAGAAATNIGVLSGALSGMLPNPSVASSVNLPGNPTTTTQASGDNSTKIATTGFVYSVLPAFYRFGPVTLSAGNIIFEGSHGLGGYPDCITIWATCITNDATYTAGQSVYLNPSTYGSPYPVASTFEAISHGIVIIPSATQIIIGESSNGISILNSSWLGTVVGNYNVMTDANWQIYGTAVRFN